MEDIYNFANELYQNEMYDDAIYFLNQYIEESDYFNEEKLRAYRNRYKAYYFKDKMDEARKACFEVFVDHLPMAEECYFLGLTYTSEEKYNQAIFWFERIFTLEKPIQNYIEDEEVWSFKPYIQLTICYYQLGDVETAFKYHQLARQINSENKYIKYNDNFFRKLGFKFK